MTEKLTTLQQKYLRGAAHNLKPVVFIGQKGVAGSVIAAIDEAFNKHELIKIKFNEFKEKAEKKSIIEIIEQQTRGQLCGLIGHVAIFYRRHRDPDKRKITLPNTRQEE